MPEHVLLAPDDPEPHYDKGLTYAEMGEFLQAIDDLSKGLGT
ncbi:MAG: tetratricopeptide repeat protein [Chloroflexota bacterium]|nr:tetratricopeptide repeat protein [Chloroflexota bacterium]MDE2885937.1 tetratricopeptide repeat protein [Chloroflexota bacterium]